MKLAILLIVIGLACVGLYFYIGVVVATTGYSEPTAPLLAFVGLLVIGLGIVRVALVRGTAPR